MHSTASLTSAIPVTIRQTVCGVLSRKVWRTSFPLMPGMLTSMSAMSKACPDARASTAFRGSGSSRMSVRPAICRHRFMLSRKSCSSSITITE